MNNTNLNSETPIKKDKRIFKNFIFGLVFFSFAIFGYLIFPDFPRPVIYIWIIMGTYLMFRSWHFLQKQHVMKTKEE